MIESSWPYCAVLLCCIKRSYVVSVLCIFYGIAHVTSNIYTVHISYRSCYLECYLYRISFSWLYYMTWGERFSKSSIDNSVTGSQVFPQQNNRIREGVNGIFQTCHYYDYWLFCIMSLPFEMLQACPAGYRRKYLQRPPREFSQLIFCLLIVLQEHDLLAQQCDSLW